VQAAQAKFDISDFVPMAGMQNRHMMTILASRWVRRFPSLIENQKQRIIEVDQKASVLVECNYAERPAKNGERSIVIILHGLEGSSRSHYVMGLAEKLVANGISAARMNMRNCGGTMHLSRTLYNAGLSADLTPVSEYFLNEGFDNVFFVGFSLGGNVVLKAAAELSERGKTWMKGVCAISPSLDLHACVTALEQWFNRIYELNFLRSLKAKIVEKDKLQPGKYDLSFLPKIKSVRSFDDIYTAPDGGYMSAGDYYSRASSLQMIPSIVQPVLIITAQDDPFVPFSSFLSKDLSGNNVTLLAPIYGGHAGFVGQLNGFKKHGSVVQADESLPESIAGAAATIPPAVTLDDRFWAEKACVEFFLPLVQAGL
jgi:predicted alpha/beta-fold hydrolase